MNQAESSLYQRIQAFSLDDANAHRKFSQRLARENGWDDIYTQRSIEEYKKFIFLAVTARHPITPSDRVDIVWHLHLLYTQSYWGEFCQQVLQHPLHHTPSLGGSSEQAKYYEIGRAHV